MSQASAASSIDTPRPSRYGGALLRYASFSTLSMALQVPVSSLGMVQRTTDTSLAEVFQHMLLVCVHLRGNLASSHRRENPARNASARTLLASPGRHAPCAYPSAATSAHSATTSLSRCSALAAAQASKRNAVTLVAPARLAGPD